jgi:dolichol-phosphate mannosyltransferase
VKRISDNDVQRSMQKRTITVLVPTRNERDNIALLLARLEAVLPLGAAQVIFVDDSSDDTPDVIKSVASGSQLPVEVIHRTASERSGGLGGAVVTGMRAAVGDVIVVMDGDLQHPPETIPDLVMPIEQGIADLVVASRYRAEGDGGGLANLARVGVSRSATTLAKLTFPRHLADVTDPMSGFFAVRTDAVDIGALKPAGFKILLEILARCPLTVAEVGFTFSERHAGDSKASLSEGLRFAHHLCRLRLSTLGSPKLRRAVGFGAVGATGLVVNAIAFWVMVRFGHLPYVWAAVLATQVSTTWNFAGMELFVFRGRESGRMWRRYIRFSILNNSVMLARLPFLALLVEVLHVPEVMANVFTLLAVFLVRFGISDKFIYKGEGDMASSKGSEGRTTRMGPIDLSIEHQGSADKSSKRAAEVYRHFYDIHGIVTIGSDVVLPELGYFEQAKGARDGVTPDVSVRIGAVPGLRKRARLVQSLDRASVRWEEHLGRLSANFAIHFGDQIQVSTSRALARSPHVLYTNVVEALLRFVFVDRGYMLLHSACMDIDGKGLMLSARTDTGKTGTVLKLLRLSEGKFLSDDMTIIDRSGVARSFPKPLTISQHTLRAVDAGDLSRTEWLWLRVQSRLHSKEGRGFALKMADMNLPIMTINSWVQRIIPPPKYFVQRLVPCQLGTMTSVSDIYIIERGEPHRSAVNQSQAVIELLENTEDAYGFPPYRYLAPMFTVGGTCYDELRQRERLILISAMESIEITRLGSDNFTWAQDITETMRAEAAADAATAAVDEAAFGDLLIEQEGVVQVEND